MLFMLGKGVPELGAGFGGVLQGIQENIPISLIQCYGFVLVNDLIGCV
jgi:hypothetical protein